MFHISGRLSNLREHLCLNAYTWLSNNLRFVIIEGDTSKPDDDVTNSAITVSSRLADDITMCPPNTQGEHLIMMFRLGSMFGFEANPDLTGCFDDSEDDHNPPMAPLQYCPKYRSIGFQPMAPDVTCILHTFHLPTNGHVVLPVSRYTSRISGSPYFLIHNPGVSWWFRPIASFVWHMAFRYADSRYKD